MLTRRWALWFILVFALMGMAVSLLATRQYFQIQRFGFEQKSFCNISETINCDLVYATAYAKVGKIPASWLGFLFYLWMGISSLLCIKKPKESGEVASFAWLLSIIGIGVSLYKAFISFYVIKVLCLLCLSMYFLNTLLLLFWHLSLKLGFFRLHSLNLKQKFLPLATGCLLLFGVGSFAIIPYHSSVVENPELKVSVEEVVRYHYKSPPLSFEVDPQAPLWGNPKAKVVVVDFSDFQCPYCKKAAFHIKPILAEFKDQVRFYYYHYPLDTACNENMERPLHKHACLASFASVCAEKNGDFWAYHDDIFRNQEGLGYELLIRLAKERGWDEEAFEKCLKDPKTIDTVKSNIVAGKEIFISSTPTVLLNNRIVKYWTDPDIFRALLQEEIRRSEQH